MNKKQRVRLSNILTNVGQVIFTASVIGPFFQGANISLPVLIIGIATAFILFIIALLLERED